MSISLGSAADPMRVYERYCGFMQGSPLSADEQKYDDTCREIDRLETEIAKLPMSLFMAHEFMWFSYRANKVQFGPKQEQLDSQLANLQQLLADLTARIVQ